MSQSEQEDEHRLLRWATTASVMVAMLLLLVKLYAWWVSGAVSVLASLVDSLMDTMASVMNFLAVRYSLKPADDRHRFGHGKAESLSGLGQSLFIMGSAVFLFMQGIERLMSPVLIQQTTVAIGVMLFSILMTSCLVMYQRHVIRRTGSLAIQADSLHYVSDLLTNLAIVIALMLTAGGWLYADALLAMLISVYIFYSAVQIWRESIQHLLDRELPKSEQEEIENIVRSHPLVLGVHGLRTRQSGRTRIIQLHLDLNGDMPLWQAHQVCDIVEQQIITRFPGADVLLHQDPVPVALKRPFASGS